jgi:hypothetical protein
VNFKNTTVAGIRLLALSLALSLTLSLTSACEGTSNMGDDTDAATTDASASSSNDSPGADVGGSDSSNPDNSGTTDTGTTDTGTTDMGSNVAASCREFGPVRAFPGAVGFGAASVGGRGGNVLVVTNLDDSGPGSLRAAVETDGPRTVVFAVAGTIELQSTLNISIPNITIAGQSAPGGGIALKTAATVTSPAIITDADDIIIQHLRVRPGPSTELSNSVDAITVVSGKRLMLANMSFSWAVDENVNFWYDASDITIQDSIVSEGLWNSTHTYQQPHSKGLIAGPDNSRMSIVRNLFAHNDDRSPLVQSNHPYEIVNNLIYNGYQVGTGLGLKENSQVNLVGNVYLPGLNYRPSRYQIIGSDVVAASLYVDDNISPRSDPNDPWAAVGWGGINGGDYNGSPLPEEARSLTPFTMSNDPIVPIAAADLQADLLPTVGASLPQRDSADTRVINDVINKTGERVDHPDDVGGWPTLAAGTTPADSDADGMPDDWETARGLNPNDASDATADRDSDGYTNIEEYLACIEG